jgi:hypothetical protein
MAADQAADGILALLEGGFVLEGPDRILCLTRAPRPRAGSGRLAQHCKQQAEKLSQ